jgi:membrane protease subunit HflK
MAWDDGNNNDPWKPRGNQGPADLDAIVKDLQRKLSGFFGGGNRGGDGGGNGPGARIGSGILSFLVVIALGLWAASGFYTVDEAEQAVVLRFGNHVNTAAPGLNWHLPFPIERVVKINTEEVVSWRYQGSMLTRDENIIIVNVIVQYRRADPEAFLFSLRDPELTLQDVTASAIREIVGKNDLDYILNEGRLDIAAQALSLLQSTLDSYRGEEWESSGITVYEVNMQEAQFPEPVQPAVRDVITASADRERRIYEAETYRNQILPRAEGLAVRQIEDAEAYRAQVVNDAQGESSRFSAILREYQRQPEVTRQRIHLETLEAIYGNSTKVLVDTDGGNNLLYLPLDQLQQRRNAADDSAQSPTTSSLIPQSGITVTSPDRGGRR